MFPFCPDPGTAAIVEAYETNPFPFAHDSCVQERTEAPFHQHFSCFPVYQRGIRTFGKNTVNLFLEMGIDIFKGSAGMGFRCGTVPVGMPFKPADPLSPFLLVDNDPLYHKVLGKQGQQRFDCDPCVAGFVKHLEDEYLGIGEEGLSLFHDGVIFRRFFLACLHIFRIKNLHVPSPAFGFVQGRVSESEEFFITAAVFRRHGDADTAADVQFFAVAVGKAAPQHVSEFFATFYYQAAVRSIPNQYYKFIAAHPAYDIRFIKHFCQGQGHVGDDSVAEQMSQVIVDFFKAVHIQDQERFDCAGHT